MCVCVCVCVWGGGGGGGGGAPAPGAPLLPTPLASPSPADDHRSSHDPLPTARRSAAVGKGSCMRYACMQCKCYYTQNKMQPNYSEAVLTGTNRATS